MDFRDIKPADIENAIGYALLQDILEARNFLSLKEKRSLIVIVSGSGIINENLIGKIQDGVKRLRQVGGVIKDEALAKIEQLATKAQGFADWMANALVGLSNRSLEYFKQKFTASKEECLILIKKDDRIIKGKIDTFRKEVDQLKQTTVFWTSEFPKQMAEKIKTLYSRYLVKESLSESGDEAHTDGKHQHPDFGFVSKATAALVKLPPFNFLGQVHDWAAMTIEKILMLFSQLTAKLGGPGIFRWVVLPFVCGAFIECHLEGKVHHFLDHMIEEAFEAEKLLKLLPGVRMILNTVGYVAMFITVYEVCQALLDWETQQNSQKEEPGGPQPVAQATHDSTGKREVQTKTGDVVSQNMSSGIREVPN